MSNERNISSGGSLAQHLFYEGKNVRAYDYLGAHRQSDGKSKDGKKLPSH